MGSYRIENLTFTYPNGERAALNDVNLTIPQGEFVTLCGPSGCGKTTLLRHLKPSTAPHGVKSGEIFFADTLLGELSARDAAAKIGFVLQSPENQIVTDKVWHELAFGLESLGVKQAEIRLRVAEMASFFGMQTWFHKPVTELSGGQKQLLALASIMALNPTALILDEPTSQLDPIAAGEFLAIVGKINRELGVTVILTEHRLEEAFPLSTRAIVMDNGQIIADGSPLEVGNSLKGQNHGMFLAMPTPMRVWAACNGDGACPVTVRDGAAWLKQKAPLGKGGAPQGRGIVKIVNPQSAEPTAPLPKEPLKPAITIDDIYFKYEKNLPDVVKGLSLTANYGKITAILGGNGTGKTTTLSLIGGLHKPYRGKIHTAAQVYTLPQNPQSLFVAKTVREDLLEILSEQKFPKDEKMQRLAAMVKLCRLDGLLDRHPYDLSGGEQQRAALAKVLLLQPKILLLDEPTKGLDAEFKQIFAAILRKLTTAGVAVIMVSHDVEFCAEYADRCALFFDGNIVTENTPREFFGGNSFYTTAANRMARSVLPDAVTANDIILTLGGKLLPVLEIGDYNPPAPNGDIPFDKGDFKAPLAKELSAKLTEDCHNKIQPRNLSKRTIIAAIMILLTIPLTIFVGIHFFGDRRFYFISMLIMLQTMLPFALVFEGRKPEARELVIIAVLCALAVAGRAAFFMLPQFKPVIAIVIIAGVAFGGEAGFLVGAMTMFVSNMYFGQGPHTPWQMFAMGMIGFLAGALFHKGILSRKTIPLCIFGAFATFIIYGGIMNSSTVLMFQPHPTIEMFIMSYFYGAPFDIIHALATMTFLLLISRPMLEKLNRIKLKYGLIE
ncbi:MAG: ATP-binding cassette domain-containing protein [Oscillospiraceae bacterium]|nr:ATP-binding cassette domain-containing protein [Oscillospiraceae bacterium]